MLSTPPFSNLFLISYTHQWRCTSELDRSVKLGRTTVTCEGYDYPDDPYVLAGRFEVIIITFGSHWTYCVFVYEKRQPSLAKSGADVIALGYLNDFKNKHSWPFWGSHFFHWLFLCSVSSINRLFMLHLAVEWNIPLRVQGITLLTNIIIIASARTKSFTLFLHFV